MDTLKLLANQKKKGLSPGPVVCTQSWVPEFSPTIIPKAKRKRFGGIMYKDKVSFTNIGVEAGRLM